MRTFKLITSALVVGIILIFINQNLTGFRTPVRFSLDLFIHEPLSWQHSVYGLMLISSLVGFVLGAVVLLRPYIHMRRLLAEKRIDMKEPETPPSQQQEQVSSEAPSPPSRTEPPSPETTPSSTTQG